MENFDHPIFLESIHFIKSQLGETGLENLEQDVLERMIHSSGDFAIKELLRFSPKACEKAIDALNSGASIITDTSMAAEAIKPMASRTLNTKVFSCLKWAPKHCPQNATRTSLGIKFALQDFVENKGPNCSPVVVIGSSPTALEIVLDLSKESSYQPPLIIGMPVGFIGVINSKERLLRSNLNFVCLQGNRGGASLAAACINALLRASLNR